MENEMETKKPFSELVGEALGRASMAWSETPKGIFDSDTCSVLHIEIMNAYTEEMKELKQKCYDLEMALGPRYEWSYEGGVGLKHGNK